MKKVILMAMGIIFISTVYTHPAYSKKGFNPLKDRITTSEKFRLEPGQTELSRGVEIPNCGLSGFVVDSVTVSPGIWHNAGQYEDDPLLALWSVNVNLWSSAISGEAHSVPLNLYGTGYEAVSVRIKNGQVGVDNDIEFPENSGEYIRYLRVTARIIGNYTPSLRHIFNVHISGQCRSSYKTTATMDEPLLNE